MSVRKPHVGKGHGGECSASLVLGRFLRQRYRVRTWVLIALIAYPLGFASTAFAQRGEATDAQADDAGPAPVTANDIATDDVRSPETSGWSALPVAIYTPETELGLGGFGLYYWRDGHAVSHRDAEHARFANRPSSLAVVGLYTTKNQVLVDVVPEFYLGGGHVHAKLNVAYRRFPDSFWGVGREVRDHAEERYDFDALRVQAQIFARERGGVYGGGLLEFEDATVTPKDAGELMAAQVHGADGSRLTGVGFAVGMDTRDVTTDTSRGFWHEFRLRLFDSALGGNADFAQYALDLRNFTDLGGGHVFASQLLFEGSSGRPPFHRLATLGGPFLLRGYYSGRFRDRFHLAGQLEYRFPLFWRLRGVVFAGAGQVASDWGKVSANVNHVEVAAGGGLRFALDRDERLNVRLDMGVGRLGPAFYFHVSEAF